MNDPEVMHILQAVRNVRKLRRGSVGNPAGSKLNTGTHKSNAVCIRVFSNKLIDVTVVHPLGNHGKLVGAERNPQQR